MIRTKLYMTCATSAILIAFIVGACSDRTPVPPPPLQDGDAIRKDIEQKYIAIKRRFPDLPEISAEELHDLLTDDKIIIVDVRTQAERDISIIPGAISKKEFDKNAGQYREHTVVTQCTIGYRSGITGKKLAGKGFKVKNLKGGILAWTHAEGPLVDPNGNPTTQVHTYGTDWNLLPPGYQATW